MGWKVFFHQLRPQQAGGPQLGGFHEEVHADGEEEGQARREFVDVHACGQRCTHILDAVGDGVAEFLYAGRAGFLHVIAGNRNRVKARHVLRGIADDVGHDAHRRFGRIYISVPHHEFFQDVVLQRAGQLLRRYTLFLGGDDVHRHDRQNGAVHRHRYRHLVERDAVEQDLHVFDGVDGNAGFTDIAHHSRMVGVVAAVSSQVESDRQALLTGGQILAIERVGFFGSGEARILTHRPGAAGIHRCTRAAHETARNRADCRGGRDLPGLRPSRAV